MRFASDGDVGAWAERLLLSEQVAIAPGSAFGSGEEGWIRVCAASAQSELLAGIGLLPSPAGNDGVAQSGNSTNQETTAR